MGLEMPNVYFLFYEYFFKPSVGDVRWKRACMEVNDKNDLLGSVQAEAFAMIVLKNNYFAWLLDSKEKLKNLLVTDYDPDSKRAGMRTASEVYLKRLQLTSMEAMMTTWLLLRDMLSTMTLKRNGRRW